MEIGTGWIGWSEEITLSTRIPAILAAYKGRCDMLTAVFGGGEDQPAALSEREVTPTLFDALFG